MAIDGTPSVDRTSWRKICEREVIARGGAALFGEGVQLYPHVSPTSLVAETKTVPKARRSPSCNCLKLSDGDLTPRAYLELAISRRRDCQLCCL